ncbi:TetR/AcrR family transcriptional regulator [Streptomyces sp. GZWMJZ-114]|uniref:TetR/AcrR family transcriptional regulator n=1 Tax=Streptomyces sp. GZWMJZ-114 TaxID=2494734 RepID=UPI001F50FB0D|nr:TetR/AcrR family transcriptional regulator [Streptomyces sp. GZWMJZ-114]
MERSDAARNRARLLEAAVRLIGECGVEQLTMEAVAREAGVGKGTLFRRFGDRGRLLLTLLAEAEADFQEACLYGPPPLGPGAPAHERLTAFGCALIERMAAGADPGAALIRQLSGERRYISDVTDAYHRHVSGLLRDLGVMGDRDVLAHALLAFLDIDALDHLHRARGIPVARIQAAWADLVRRVVTPGAPAEG